MVNSRPRATYWGRMKRWFVCTAAIALTVACGAPRAQACKPDLVGEPTKLSPATNAALPTNGRIVMNRSGGLLQGAFGESLLQIDEHHPELRSDRDRVALRVVETYDQRAGETVILAAAHQLRPSTSYTLVFDPPLENAPRATWTTASSDDRSPPRWLARPTTDAPICRRSNCSVDSHVAVNVPTADAAWIRVEWRQHGERRWRLSLSAPTDGQVFVWLPPDERYTLKLTAIDSAGNEVAAPGRPLEVVVPCHEVATRK
jgi:hypothetical protein